MTIVNVDVGSVVDGLFKGLDGLFTSDEERERAKLAMQVELQKPHLMQAMANIHEAQHKSVFVAGWRPMLGWVGALAMFYQFLLYPLLTWGWAVMQAGMIVPQELSPPPMLDTDALWVILTGILGLGGMRSWDKRNKVSTEKL